MKSVKGEIEEMRTETLALGKQNGEDYARIVKDSAEVGTLYRQINEMELELARLKSTHPPEKVCLAEDVLTTADDHCAGVCQAWRAGG